MWPEVLDKPSVTISQEKFVLAQPKELRHAGQSFSKEHLQMMITVHYDKPILT